MSTHDPTAVTLEKRLQHLEAEIATVRSQLEESNKRQSNNSTGNTRNGAAASLIKPGFSHDAPNFTPASTSAAHTFSLEELKRYGRQMILPQIGPSGQQKLKNVKIAVVGAGGLGCPALMYLAGAGIGTLGVIDSDSVDVSNLHRQILYNRSQCGMSKVDAAAQSLYLLNEHVKVNKHKKWLTADEIELLSPYDIILDCTDNQESRYLVSDACVLLEKPLVWAAALKLEGQICVFNHQNGPCYRCLFPVPAPSYAVSSCSDSGILGPLVGFIGTLQALQAIRIALKESFEKTPSMLFFSCSDGLKFRSSKIRGKQSNCVSCGSRATLTRESLSSMQIKESPSSSTHCARESSSVKTADECEYPNSIFHASVAEIAGHLNELTLLDIRSKTQYEICHLPGAISLPKDDFNQFRALGLKPGTVHVYCKAGITSKKSIPLLMHNFPEFTFINIDGGLKQWAEDIDPLFPIC